MARYRPGQKAPYSGQYPILDTKVRKTGEERTSTNGDPLPPLPKRGYTYGDPDRTRHRRK